jgi:hypothetical protein
MAQAASDHYQTTDAVLANWRQGDVILKSGLSFVHLALLRQPLTPAAAEVAGELTDSEGSDRAIIESEAIGFVVLTQTCDLVRGSQTRPYVELAPLVEVPPDLLEGIRRLKRPAFAYVPTVADQRLVADL